MPTKGVQFISFRRERDDGSLFKTSSNFLATNKSVIPSSILSSSFSELEILSISAGGTPVTFKDILKNSPSGSVLNVRKLLKLVPKGSTGTFTFTVLPPMPSQGGSKEQKMRANILTSFQANRMWRCGSAQGAGAQGANLVDDYVFSTRPVNRPQILFLKRKEGVVVCFGPSLGYSSIPELKPVVLSIPIESLIETIVGDPNKDLIVTGTLAGGVAAQLLTLLVVESKSFPIERLHCVSFNSPTLIAPELFSEFEVCGGCFTNVLEEDRLLQLAVASSIGYIEQESEQLQLADQVKTSLDCFAKAKATKGCLCEFPEGSVNALLALLSDTNLGYVGNVVVVADGGTTKVFPQDDHDVLSLADISGECCLGDMVCGSLSIQMNDPANGLVSAELLEEVTSMVRQSPHEICSSGTDTKGFKSIIPSITKTTYVLLKEGDEVKSCRLVIEGEHLDSVLRSEDEWSGVDSKKEEEVHPMYLKTHTGRNINYTVEERTSDKLTINVSPLVRPAGEGIPARVFTMFGHIDVLFTSTGESFKGLTSTEMKQLGLNEEGLMRMIGILFLDVAERVKQEKALQSGLADAIECLRRMELVTESTTILSDTIHAMLASGSVDVPQLLAVAKPVVESFVASMTEPVTTDGLPQSKRFSAAFKARLSLTTGGFLRLVGKKGSSTLAKGQVMQSIGRVALHFGEANIRYSGVLRLLAAAIGNEEQETAGMGLTDLETFVVYSYNRQVTDHSLTFGDISKPRECLVELIKAKMQRLKRGNSKIDETTGLLGAVLMKEYSGVLDDLTRRLIASGQLCMLRDMFSKVICVSFVGAHNAGKSTLLQELFNIDTSPSFFERTLQVTAYKPKVYGIISQPDMEGKHDIMNKLRQSDLRFVDFPGATDEREIIRAQTSALIGLSSLVVVVFNAVHVAQAECEIVEAVKQKGLPFVVLLNQADKVVKNLELEHKDIFPSTTTTTTNNNSNSNNNNNNNNSGDNNDCDMSEDTSGNTKTVLNELKRQSATRLHIPLQSIHLSSSFKPDPVRSFIFSSVQHLTGIDPRTLFFLLSGDDGLKLLNSSAAVLLDILDRLKAHYNSTNTIPGSRNLAKLVTIANIVLLDKSGASWRDFFNTTEIEIIELLIRRGILGESFILEKLKEHFSAVEDVTIGSNLKIFGVNGRADIPALTWREVLNINVMPKGVEQQVRPIRAYTHSESRDNVKRVVQQSHIVDKTILRANAEDPSVFVNSILGMTGEDFKRDVTCSDGTEAIDCGGVVVSYITGVCKQVSAKAADSKYAMLLSSSSNTIYPSPDFKQFDAADKRRHTDDIKLLFRLIALSLSQIGRNKNFLLPFHLSPTIFKIVLGYPLTINDINELNLPAFNAIKTIVDAAASGCDIGDLCLSTVLMSPSDKYCELPIWPTKDEPELTSDNMVEYILDTVDYLLWADFDFGPLVREFNQMVDIKGISPFVTPQTLQLMCCGAGEIDVEDMIANTDFVNFGVAEREKIMREWMVAFMRQMSKEIAALFISFFTGTATPPVGGFASLTPRISVYLDTECPADYLPTGSTCFNRVTTPVYPTYKCLVDKFSLAILGCGGTDFGRK